MGENMGYNENIRIITARDVPEVRLTASITSPQRIIAITVIGIGAR
jgi:hypothetical protein